MAVVEIVDDGHRHQYIEYHFLVPLTHEELMFYFDRKFKMPFFGTPHSAQYRMFDSLGRAFGYGFFKHAQPNFISWIRVFLLEYQSQRCRWCSRYKNDTHFNGDIVSGVPVNPCTSCRPTRMHTTEVCFICGRAADHRTGVCESDVFSKAPTLTPDAQLFVCSHHRHANLHTIQRTYASPSDEFFSDPSRSSQPLGAIK